MFWAAFLVSSMFVAAPPSAASAPGSSEEQAGPSRALLITLKENKSHDPALEAALPVSVAAAFELSEGYQVVTDEESADWDLQLYISGEGPWKLRAEALPLGDNQAKRLSRTVQLENRDQIARAAGTLADDLDEAGLGLARSLAVSGFAEGLSAIPEAVEAYLTGEAALREGDIESAGASWDRSISSDPDFLMAAAEALYLDLTRDEDLEASRTADTGGESVPGQIFSGLASLARGDPERALDTAEGLRGRHPDLLWGRVLRGLSLARAGRCAESVEDWRAVAAVRGNDPRARMWLGRALFAAGDAAGAASAFHAARESWPGLLRAYTLEAEAQVRMRETMAARTVLNEMHQYMDAHQIVPTSDDLHAGLMLGSVEFLEGHFTRALATFEQEADAMEEAGQLTPSARTLHRSIIEMRRDQVNSKDPVARELQIQEVRKALERYEDLLPADEREHAPFELLRFKGLLSLKEGNQVEAWQYVEQLKSLAEQPGYSEYYEAYLSAAAMLKEGDIKGCLEQFQRAAVASGHVAPLMDVARRQSQLGLVPETRSTLDAMERRLSRYDEWNPEYSDLILAEPHLAAIVPLYHYFRAEFAYNRGNVADSRKHFNYLLKYLQEPDERLQPMVKEALMRGAKPE